MKEDMTLGISPGTRFVGIALIKDNRIIQAQVRSYRGKWSRSKREKILSNISDVLEQHTITGVVVKLPDVLPLSRSFHELIGSLNRLFERDGIKPVYYSLSEIKMHHSGSTSCTIDQLMELIVRIHPELLLEYRREKKNRNAYYYKLFEAVSAGMM